MAKVTAKKGGKRAAVIKGRGRKAREEAIRKELKEIALGTEVAELGRLEERREYLVNKKQTTGLNKVESRELLVHEKLNPIRKKRLYHKLSQG